MDVGDETLEETGPESFLETRNVRRSCIGGEDDLPAGGLEGIESVEELLLRPLFSGDELDVVEEQDIDSTKGLTKGLHLLPADAVDELVDKLFGGHVRDFAVGIGGDHAMADGVQEVRLAKTGTTIDIERVVGFPGVVGDSLSGGGGELVGCALDKTLKDEGRAERVAGQGDSRRVGGVGPVIT